MALTAALLGWLFDGLEMGLFPLVAGPALEDLGVPRGEVTSWLGIITAFFLVGAATGGVLFGWLGDRIGRVRSMMLSVLTYTLVTGMCAFATTPWQIGILRFVAALGMGGEWSLGVALINEIWPARSRAFLAGLIGAAANVGYLLIALVGQSLLGMMPETRSFLLGLGLSPTSVDSLLAYEGWRLLMIFGALPALLTFFIRLFVPESPKWEQERARGATSFWARRDLLGVLVGATAACGMIVLWAVDLPLLVQIFGSLACLVVVTTGYTWPVILYLKRSELAGGDLRWRPTLRRMSMGACLSGVALLGTWGTTQQAATWARQLVGENERARGGEMNEARETEIRNLQAEARSQTQVWLSIGAIIGTILAALIADKLGRRLTYTLLCLGSLIVIPTFFLTCRVYDSRFVVMVFLAGTITASFYGWLPLYLPELFPTRVRATGQGFGFNFGRVLAAVGVLQLGNLQDLFRPYGWRLAEVCSLLSLIYIVGMVLIWFVPETRGRPLPE